MQDFSSILFEIFISINTYVIQTKLNVGEASSLHVTYLLCSHPAVLELLTGYTQNKTNPLTKMILNTVQLQAKSPAHKNSITSHSLLFRIYNQNCGYSITWMQTMVDMLYSLYDSSARNNTCCNKSPRF